MTRKKSDEASQVIMGYRPERRQYQVRDDASVLARITQGKNMSSRVRKGAQKAAADVGGAVQEVSQQLDQAYGLQTETFDHMVDLFTSKHELGIPADKRYVSFDSKSSKPADIIFRVLGMVAVDGKAEYISPAGSDRSDKADLIERHLNALPGWLFRKYKKRWDYQSLFWQLLVGRSYLKQSYLPFYWDKSTMTRKAKEEDGEYNKRVAGYRGHAGPPIFRESIDPRMMFPLETPMGPEGYVSIFRVTRLEVDDALLRVGKRALINQKGEVEDVLSGKRLQELPRQSDGLMPLDGAVDYYEYLDDVYCYYVVGNTVVEKYKHDGGIKVFPGYGLQTGMNDYHLMSMGILWAVRNEIPQYDFLRTLWAQKAYLDVFRQLFVELDGDMEPLRDAGGGEVLHFDIEPGTVKQIRGRVTDPLSQNTAGLDFRSMLEMYAGAIDLATIPGLMRGIAGAQQAGFAINQLVQSVRTEWRPIIQSARLQRSEQEEHYLSIVKNQVDRPVTVFAEVADPTSGHRSGQYIELHPKDIEEYARVDVDMEPDLPIDKQGNMLVHSKLLEQGFLDWDDWVREGLGKTNPEEYYRKVVRTMGRRAMFPKALEDAQALGRVELNNRILKERGLDRLNDIGNIDIQQLKAARAQQQVDPTGAGGAGPGAPLPQTVATGTPNGGPQTAAASAGQTGGGIPPTVGANPADPYPGPRMGSGT